MMRYHYMIGLLLVGVLALSVPMRGQQPAPAAGVERGTRVAVADPARIFDQLQETHDFKQRLEAMRRELADEEAELRQKVESLQEALSRVVAGTPQYLRDREALDRAMLEYDMWGRMAQARLHREQKHVIWNLYNKIRTTTGEVARERGIDLVVADNRPRFPEDLEEIPLERLQALIGQQGVLYASDTVDLSEAIIARMDQRHREGGAP